MHVLNPYFGLLQRNGTLAMVAAPEPPLAAGNSPELLIHVFAPPSDGHLSPAARFDGP